RDQVVQSETVVRRDEVDRGERAALIREGVGGPRESGGEAADAHGSRRRAARVVDVAQPEVADAIAVAVVPLVPAVAEVPGLPPAHADVPRLRDLLDARELR